MREGDRLAPSLMLLGATGVIVGSFWPWVASGRRNRSSYQVFELVERLGFAPDGLVGWGLRLWPIVPLLVVGATVASWFDRRIVAGALGVLGALYAGAVGVAMARTPDRGLVRVLGAPSFTAAAAVILLIGAAIELVVVVRSRQVATA